jgi:hypothetical protein
MSYRSLAGVAAAAAAAVAVAAGVAHGTAAVRVPLHAVNGSGQSGVAVLTPTADGYTVVVRVTGKRVQDGEHDHIHNLSCARYARIARHPNAPTAAQINRQLATVSVGLGDIYNGRSRTPVALPLADVTKGGFSINVHEAGYPYTAVACGDIPSVHS